MSDTTRRQEMTAENFNPTLTKTYRLEAEGSWPESHHQFDDTTVWAVKTAMACGRPLLVRGEPGIGKSQLARAVAAYFQVPFLSFVVNARSECRDLLYSHDVVSRLAQAQVLGNADAKTDWRAELSEERFVRPGKLWWAINWNMAAEQAKQRCRKCNGKSKTSDCCPECGEPPHKHLKGWTHDMGAVLLVDEIDKADADFSNGLLESFGNTGFEVEPTGQVIHPDGRAPLLVITTNEDKELPPAFLRRCLVLHIPFPEDDAGVFLKERGKIHFKGLASKIYDEAADLVLNARQEQKERWVKPGAAEYLDILRALEELFGKDAKKQSDALRQVAQFSLNKNPESNGR